MKPFLEILAALVISAALIMGFSLYFFDLYDATQIFYGVGLSIFNLLFYSLIAGLIFVKKNIAWIVPIIVIKYSLLIVAIYLIWAHCKPLFVVGGMISELIITAFVWLIIKKVLLKRTSHGPL